MYVAKSDIKIDPDVLENQTEVYSSLSDVNHIPVFTDGYGENIAQKKKMALENESKLQRAIFQGEISITQSTDDIVNEMFLADNYTVIKQDSQNDISNSKITYICLSIFVLLFLVFLALYVEKRKQNIK